MTSPRGLLQTWSLQLVSFRALLLLLTWQEGSRILLALRAEQRAPALGEAGATAGSTPVLTPLNAAGGDSGAGAEAAVPCLMLPWLKFYQVLETAGAHKANLKS